MRLLLGTERIVDRGGSATYLLTVAEHLRRLGHEVVLRAREADHGLAGEHSLRLVTGDAAPPGPWDAVLVQDAPSAYLLADALPEAPQLFVAHSDLDETQLPPQLPDVCRLAVALDDRARQRLEALAAPPRVARLRRFVDLEPLVSHRPLPARARRVLVLGDQPAVELHALVADVSAELGLELEVAETTAAGRHRERIRSAEIVVAGGQAVVEAMACGRGSYVWGRAGADGWVHGHWASLDDEGEDRYPDADLIIYHLRMIHPFDRMARRRRYERLDPGGCWQDVGYEYLTDPAGLVLAHLPLERDYHPPGRRGRRLLGLVAVRDTLRGEDRLAHYESYLRLDPEALYDLGGYEHLVDDTGIELRPPEDGLDYRAAPVVAAAA